MIYPNLCKLKKLSIQIFISLTNYKGGRWHIRQSTTTKLIEWFLAKDLILRDNWIMLSICLPPFFPTIEFESPYPTEKTKFWGHTIQEIKNIYTRIINTLHNECKIKQIFSFSITIRSPMSTRNLLNSRTIRYTVLIYFMLWINLKRRQINLNCFRYQ